MSDPITAFNIDDHMIDASRYANTVQPTQMLVPGSLMAAAQGLATGTATSATQMGSAWKTASFSSTADLADAVDIHKRVSKIEENHLVIAKDQEDRICELESAVTDLMELTKEQKKIIKDLGDRLDNPMYVAGPSSASNQYGIVHPVPPPPPPPYSSGLAGLLGASTLGASASNAQQNLAASAFQQGFASHSHMFSTTPTQAVDDRGVSLPPDSLVDKTKRILGIK